MYSASASVVCHLLLPSSVSECVRPTKARLLRATGTQYTAEEGVDGTICLGRRAALPRGRLLEKLETLRCMSVCLHACVLVDSDTPPLCQL